MENQEIQFEGSKESQISTHTAKVKGVNYDIYKLIPLTESLPVQSVSVKLLEQVIASGDHNWTDTEENKFNPYEIVRNWEAAQKNPLWNEHVKAINNADLSFPILLTREGGLVDGMHRIIKAIINKTDEIKCRYVDDVLDKAVIREQNE